MTEICDRTLRKGVRRCCSKTPRVMTCRCSAICLAPPQRVAMGMGANDVIELREIGKLLAFLKEPDPPKGMRDAWEKLPIFRKV
jgi:4-hydroxy-3-polyprenylbenzoate decarboxylase